MTAAIRAWERSGRHPGMFEDRVNMGQTIEDKRTPEQDADLAAIEDKLSYYESYLAGE